MVNALSLNVYMIVEVKCYTSTATLYLLTYPDVPSVNTYSVFLRLRRILTMKVLHIAVLDSHTTIVKTHGYVVQDSSQLAEILAVA